MNILASLLLICIILTKISQLCGCCNSCNTNCCSNCCTTCQNQCSSNRCMTQCQRTCCVTPPECTTLAPTSSTTPTTSITTTTTEEPSVTPVRVISTTTERQITRDESSNQMINNLTSTNIVNNDNKINIQISVSSRLVNNINNTVPSRPTGIITPITNRTGVVIKEVVVKVPVCSPNCTTSTSTTSTTPWTISTPAPTNCCTIIVPCVSYGCNPYHYRCDDCRGDIGYVPINPCHKGCHRRPVWYREKCVMGHCFTRPIDCSHCNSNFYQTYDQYWRCYGCFYQ